MIFIQEDGVNAVLHVNNPVIIGNDEQGVLVAEMDFEIEILEEGSDG